MNELTLSERMQVFQAQRQAMRSARENWYGMTKSKYANLASGWREQYLGDRRLAKKLAEHFNLETEL